MPNRTYTLGGAAAYRYGYNGKEADKSEWGSLTQYDYGFRIYNPALGRFLSIDPISRKYPQLTPYQYASNRPIDGIDLDGLEWVDGAQGYLLEPKRSGDPATDNSGLIESMMRQGYKPSLPQVDIIAKAHEGGPSLTTSVGNMANYAVHGMGYAFGTVGGEEWHGMNNSVDNAIFHNSARKVANTEVQLAKAELAFGGALLTGGGSLSGFFAVRGVTLAGLSSAGVDAGFQMMTNNNFNKLNVTSVLAEGILRNPFGSAFYGEVGKITVGDIRNAFQMSQPELLFNSTVFGKNGPLFGKDGSGIGGVVYNTALNGFGNSLSDRLFYGIRAGGQGFNSAGGAVKSLGTNAAGNAASIMLNNSVDSKNGADSKN